MDSLTLTAVAAGLQHDLLGRRLGGVVLPRREQLVVGLGLDNLLISIAAAEARVHRVPSAPLSPKPEPSLQTHFDSLLRGALVTGVTVPDFDRVLHLTVESVDQVGTVRPLTLIVEVMGKHSACVVVDAEQRIVATLKTVTRAVNRHRELLPKATYVPPPQGDRLNPLRLDAAGWDAIWPALAGAERLKDGWRAHLFGLSNELWAWLCERAGLADDAAGADATAGERLWAAVRELQEVVRTDGWQPSLRRDDAGHPVSAWPLPLPGAEPLQSLDAGLAAVAGAAGERYLVRQGRGDLLAAVERHLARVDSQIKGLDRATHRAEQAAGWQHLADLVLANVHAIAPRAESVTVADWEAAGQEVVIPLDPQLNGPRNAEALYDRARRARRALDTTPYQREDLAAERGRLSELVAQLRAATSSVELAELAVVAERLVPAAATTKGPARPKTERDRWLAKLERHETSDGYVVLVGRNAKESEGLLSRVAAGTDLWFHVRGAGSGHVILRTEGRPDEVPPRAIEEAARWAAKHSKSRHSSLVPVVYTQRKYVTKVTGGAAGKVVYRFEKSLFIEP